MKYISYKWYIVQGISIMRPLFALMFFIYFSNVFIRKIFFFLSFISDFFDGFFARKWNVVSRFGSVLDPICDKASIYIFFLCFPIGIHQILFYSMICKDLLVMIGGIYYQYKFKTAPITLLGKSTMVFVGLYLGGLIISDSITLKFNFDIVIFFRNMANISIILYIVQYIYMFFEDAEC